MAVTPEASCLTCRKRQVKCDGNRPTCNRCPKDKLSCRGYKGQLRFVQVNPTKPAKTGRSRPIPVSKEDQTLPTFPLTKHICVDQRDVWTLTQCAHYWNEEVIPSILPAERPFFRPLVTLDWHWQELPKVAMCFVILAFRSTQAAKLLMDPTSQPDLCHYRGMGLRELPQYLDGAATDPQGIALSSIMMLMLSDLLLPDSTWLLHLEAVQRIVAMRGGVAECIKAMPDLKFVMVQYLVTDALTSTTSNSAQLQRRVMENMVRDIPNIDFQCVTCGCICPAELLLAVARTSRLRAVRRQALIISDETEPEPCEKDFAKLLEDIESLNCEAWAVRMSHLGLVHPITESNVRPCTSTAGLTHVAQTFQAAALLYLHLSCSDSNNATTIPRAQAASKQLYAASNALFAKASHNWNGPLDTQLWKFITWPLVIAAYAWAGWDVWGGQGDLDEVFGRLDMIAVAKGTKTRSCAGDYMSRVRTKRARVPEGEWTWDMGFRVRQNFVL